MQPKLLSRRTGLAACSTVAFLAATIGGQAAPYLFKNVAGVGEYLAYDNAKPTIADNGSIAFLNIIDYVTNERITVAPAFGDNVVLLDSNDPVRPLNVVGPGISDDGAYVAYMARENVTGGFPIDRIYRQPATGGPAVLIAEPGSITDEHPGDPIGAASCRGICRVSEHGSFIGDGAVLFSTLNPSTLSFGDGGPLETFATGGAIGLHDEFHQSGNGFVMAVMETGGGRQEVRGGFFTIGPEWENTDGEYSEFRSPNFNDSLNAAIIAERDLGGEEILRGIDSEFSTFASTNGAFAGFSDLSLGDGGDVAFLATLDTPGSGKAIYTGANPVTDRLIGPGDKLFNKTVVAVDLAPSDAVNEKGQIAFAVRFANDTSRIVKASKFKLQFAPALKLLMSTLDQNVQPMLSTDVQMSRESFDIQFDLDFLQDKGVLEVFLGGTLLARYTPEFDGVALIKGIDPSSIFQAGIPDTARLEFRLGGGPDVSLHLGNIVMPGLFNGDFEQGYLDGWSVFAGRPGLPDPIPPGDPRYDDPDYQPEPPRAGIIALVQTQPAPVPLPAGAWLLAAGLSIMGFLRRRPS